ncbi:hypothetical protein Taro_022108 [Colocasia esculenta]|uniref:AAA+ ATPase domain-containing protein n=1 Tax=Colocasia esculenta TaxID=4460 RepID=A0A843V0S7_COLES|nr:hypothetical protein [Colocasia esculenta]
MGCGRRMRGRPSPSVVDRGLLHKRIRELEPLVDIYDGGAMVERLRELYWDYANKKLQPFTHCVQQALERCQHQRRRLQAKHGRDWGGGAEEDGIIEGASTPSSRSVKRPREEAAPVSPARSTTPVSSTSSSSSSSAESDDGDAVYKAKVKPEFDLVKSALREGYSKSRQQPAGGSRGKPETDVQEENAMDSKPRRTAELVGRTAVVTPGPVAGGEGFASVAGEGRDGPRFKDFGGIKALLEELTMEVVVPLCHPHLPRMLGVKPMAGILLHGPPGCGKTKLAHAIANETGVPFYKISATEVISGVSGASEENIRELFKKAYRTAPSIVFIDEIDAIGSKRENLQREMERRIVTQLMTCMDESHQALGTADADSDTESSAKNPGYVIVIGATNRPDAVDPALRRPGRFDRELFLGVPDENARREILSLLTVKLKLDGALDLSKIARATPGFVGADLVALVNKAGNLAMRRIIDKRKCELSTEGCEDQDVEWWRRPWAPEEIEKLSISMFDFEVIYLQYKLLNIFYIDIFKSIDFRLMTFIRYKGKKSMH